MNAHLYGALQFSLVVRAVEEMLRNIGMCL